MRAPNHECGQSICARLEHGKVADAAFIESATVINDHHATGLRRLHGFKKNIDAAEVARG